MGPEGESEMVGKSPHFASNERAAPGDPAAVTEAACCDQPERALLLLYALSSCSEEEALDFEAHLLDCDTCFEDLKTLDRARMLVREALAADSPVPERVRSSLRGIRARKDLALAARQPQA